MTMNDLLCELQGHVLLITLNRIDKHNAFDDVILSHLHGLLEKAAQDKAVRVVVIKANGRHFSAGADIGWMQRMAGYSEQENQEDAALLARVMHALYHLPKPTIAAVHGKALGGGAGLVAACDIAIAAPSARFSFSEVKLGLIPAVISPYVIKAIGARNTAALFMSAEEFDSHRALALQLVHHCVPEEELLSYTRHYAKNMTMLAPLAVAEAKALVRQVAPLPLDEKLQTLTANLIAKKRASSEAQCGLKAFLNKEPPNWN